MSDTKYTPGPWAVCMSPPNEFWHTGRTIYSVREDTRIADVVLFRRDEVAFADARLIAAAPELLDELRDALAVICAEVADGTHTEIAHSIRALIAKATGGAA